MFAWNLKIIPAFDLNYPPAALKSRKALGKTPAAVGAVYDRPFFELECDKRAVINRAYNSRYRTASRKSPDAGAVQAATSTPGFGCPSISRRKSFSLSSPVPTFA